MANGRCRMHGGPSTGPRTPQGLANSRQARLRHGRYSATRKRLRRQLRWVRKFVKVLHKFAEMNQSLFDLGEALEMGQPLGELAPKCLQELKIFASSWWGNPAMPGS
jgi:hypothetical protein